MNFSKDLIMNQRRKKFVKKTTKFDHLFDTKDFIPCVVCNETVDEKSFKNLNIKFVIFQTKEICQFLLLLRNR